MLEPFMTEGKVEVGLDEAGRGCLMGPVCAAGVILDPKCNESPKYPLKDSKKCSPKIREYLCEYIQRNALAYSVQFVKEGEIDAINILQATMKGMHRCLEEIEGKTAFDTVLVDGTYFPYYTDKNFEVVDHVCVKGGDDTYQSIAAASILAKTYRDRYIVKLVSEETCLEAYDIANNKGYGTKKHMEALRELGPTKYHRLSFKPCQKFT
jgi:ribonuclease HII